LGKIKNKKVPTIPNQENSDEHCLAVVRRILHEMLEVVSTATNFQCAHGHVIQCQCVWIALHCAHGHVIQRHCVWIVLYARVLLNVKMIVKIFFESNKQTSY